MLPEALSAKLLLDFSYFLFIQTRINSCKWKRILRSILFGSSLPYFWPPIYHCPTQKRKIQWSNFIFSIFRLQIFRNFPALAFPFSAFPLSVFVILYTSNCIQPNPIRLLFWLFYCPLNFQKSAFAPSHLNCVTKWELKPTKSIYYAALPHELCALYWTLLRVLLKFEKYIVLVFLDVLLNHNVSKTKLLSLGVQVI